MAFNGVVLTTLGKNLQAKVQTGVQLAFTKVKIGDGVLGANQSLEALTNLLNPKMTLNIQGVAVLGDGTSRVRTIVTNTDLTAGFFVREIGVFAADPDVGEILYCIGNAGSECDYLPAGGSVVVEETLDVIMAVGNATNITAVIDESIVLATKADITEHNSNSSAHSMAMGFWQNGHVYAVGEIIRSRIYGSYKYMECTVGGTSGTTEPTWPAVGSTVTDGTVTWVVRDIRESQIGLRKNSTAYVVGDIAYSASLPSWARLECVVAGTTGNSEPAGLSSVTSAQTVADGTVTWIVRTLDIFDANSALIKKSLLTNAGGIVDGSLTANGWVKFAGGLILQWGTTAAAQIGTVPLPITFPNACLHVFLTAMGSENGNVYTGTITTSSFTWANNTWGGSGWSAKHWIAVGY